MTNFCLILRRDCSDKETQPSLDQLQQSIKSWHDWLARITLEDRLARSLQSLDRKGRVILANGLVIEGPPADCQEMVSGLVIIRASGYEEALELARHCPILDLGGTVEIRMEIPLMDDYF